jgi:hypothetical protein
MIILAFNMVTTNGNISEEKNVTIMPKKNYKAWQVNPNGLTSSHSSQEKLLYFARYAILAPSGHNTQPWLLTPWGDSLILSINPSHYLSGDGSGLLSVEPYISLGTFIETFTQAARGFGYEVNVRLFPKKEQVALFTIKDTCNPEPALLDAITARVSNRHPFKTDAINPNFIKKLTNNTLLGVAATPVTSRADIDFIKEQSGFAIASIMSQQPYRDELSTWVRVNHTRRHDGMPGFTHGFGNVVSLLSKQAIKKGLSPGKQVKKAMSLIDKSGALIIIRGTEDTKEAFINAGRYYARTCIAATEAGFASSVLAASTIDPTTREAVKQHFKLTDRPIIVLRIGTATVPGRHGPRWTLESVTTDPIPVK